MINFWYFICTLQSLDYSWCSVDEWSIVRIKTCQTIWWRAGETDILTVRLFISMLHEWPSASASQRGGGDMSICACVWCESECGGCWGQSLVWGCLCDTLYVCVCMSARWRVYVPLCVCEHRLGSSSRTKGVPGWSRQRRWLLYTPLNYLLKLIFGFSKWRL